MSNLGIIYGAQSGIIRRIVLPDRDAELSSAHLGPGEAVLIRNRALGESIPELRAAVEAEIGRPIRNSRCVMISLATGEVVSVLNADPDIDAVPGHHLTMHETAMPGDVYDFGSKSFKIRAVE